MQQSLDEYVHNATAMTGQHKLQLIAAHDCNRVIADVKGTWAQLDKGFTATHPPTPPHDLVADEAFPQEMGIEPINTPAPTLEPVFQPDNTNLLVAKPLTEMCTLPEPYSDMDVLADELETATITSIS